MSEAEGWTKTAKLSLKRRRGLIAKNIGPSRGKTLYKIQSGDYDDYCEHCTMHIKSDKMLAGDG